MTMFIYFHEMFEHEEVPKNAYFQEMKEVVETKVVVETWEVVTSQVPYS